LRAEAQWEWQMPDLVDAYLHYLNNPEDAGGEDLFEISCIDVFGRSPQFFLVL